MVCEAVAAGKANELDPRAAATCAETRARAGACVGPNVGGPEIPTTVCRVPPLPQRARVR